MSTRKTPNKKRGVKSATSTVAMAKSGPASEAYLESVMGELQIALKGSPLENFLNTESSGSTAEHKVASSQLQKAFQIVVEKVRNDTQQSYSEAFAPQMVSKPLAGLAADMQRGVEALGSALAELPAPVSPQLARSVAATEHAWRDLEEEFGLLTSMEVSALLGSDPPNRTYASHQRGQGKLLAVKRPKGLLYPGFQFSTTEPHILPVIQELRTAADEAGRSEASLALWMTRATGYLDGNRPVDRLSEPEKVLQAAKHSFSVQW